MTRPLRLLPVWLGALLCVVGVLGLYWAKPPEKEIALGDACRTPVRVLGSSSVAAPLAIVFHGFGASDAIVEPLGQYLAESGWRVYLPDLAGHGRSSEPFSYARVHECAAGLVNLLLRSGRLVPNRTIFVGHSLGAAVAVGLSRTLPVASTVAISPAMLVPPRKTPANLLIFAGQFDLGPVKTTARQLLHDAGGVRDAPLDFSRGQASALFMISGQLHGTMVLDPRVWRRTLAWGDRSVVAASPLARDGSIVRPVAALVSNFVLLAGMILLVAPFLWALAILFRTTPRSRPSVAPSLSPARTTLLRWVVASFIAVSALGLSRLGQFVCPVHLENGNWVALVALLTGILLLVLLGNSALRQFRANARELALAAVAGALVVVLFSLAMRPELVDSALSPARLWRWAVLAVFVFPYFWAEEVALGPPSRRTAGRKRFLMFLAMRGLVGLAEVYAALVFWPKGLLIVLMAIGLALIAIGQRFASDALRRRGAGVPAAALLGAILAAGTLALILPLT